jgi:tetratricopeptide (TPR) repeat protein
VLESASNTSVFWIHASNAARLEQGYQRIAAVAEIPGRDNPKINILQLVFQWLNDARNGRWVMVLDNADNDGIFFDSSVSGERGPLVNYLPQAMHGSLLVTARNGLAARNLVGTDGLVIEVQPMNEAESLALLRARISDPQPGQCGEDEKALVRALEYIPLAITQAGSYIANRSSRFTVSRYLQLFRESESNQKYFMQHEDAKDLRRDSSNRYAVITTWQLSFEQIRQDQPAATELLALMSMFDRQGIPEGLVRTDGDELQFEDTVAPLISYSLVRVELETGSFDMHRLVQLSVRTWLAIHLELARWQEKSRAIMAHVFPPGHYENWVECQRLLPHAREVLKSISDAREEDQLNVARISSNSGWYLLLQGSHQEAGVMYQRALEAQEQVLGREHHFTLATINSLGLVVHRQGKYEEAEALHRRALEWSEKMLGYEHPDTLTSVDSVGLVLSDQGKYAEAEAMHRRALEAREKVLGHDHPQALSSVSSLGNVLNAQGRYKEAEMMYRRDLEGSERVLGREHPDTLTSVNNLGLVLDRQGKYKEAEALHRRALKGYEKVVGHEHPKTLISVNNLGLVLDSQERHKEAEAMFQRALEGHEKVLGHEHPDTLGCIGNLGNVLNNQGRYKEAEEMYRRASESSEKVLGREHPHTLISVVNLGSVLCKQEEYEEAEAMHRRTLEVQETVLGQGHPHTLASVSNLGDTLFGQEKYEEAEAMHRRALEAREKVLGREHPDTLVSIGDLVIVLDKQGKHDEAEAMYRRFLEAMCRRFLEAPQVFGPE